MGVMWQRKKNLAEGVRASNGCVNDQTNQADGGGSQASPCFECWFCHENFPKIAEFTYTHSTAGHAAVSVVLLQSTKQFLSDQ